MVVVVVAVGLCAHSDLSPLARAVETSRPCRLDERQGSS